MNSEDPKSPDSDIGNSSSSRDKDLKICKVCGDKALGYNFNAITCESCKAFFRRNALKDKEFKCPFNKNCVINTITRRFCQLCRLIKCFEIGMRKDHILSEDDKLRKRKKIQQNRAIKKRPVDEDPPDDLPTKHIKVDKTFKDEDEEPDEDEEISKNKKPNPVRISLLNMASSSCKTYEKKSPGNSNVEQLVPASPAVPDPCSPGNSTIAESRTCNVFNENIHFYDSNRSRSAEIYQISKPQEIRSKPTESYSNEYSDSSIIKNILNTDASKPYDVTRNASSISSYQTEEESNLYSSDVNNGSEFMLDEDKLLELAKKCKNVVVETTKTGDSVVFIRKNALEENSRFDFKDARPRGFELSYQNKINISLVKNLNEESCEDYASSKYYENSQGSSMPLLNSLINTAGPSEKETRGQTFRTDVAEEVLRDIPRNTSLGASNSIESILSEAIKLEYEAYSSMNPRINSRELNDAERAKLNELIVANKALLAPLDDDINGLMGDDFPFNKTSSCGRPMLVEVLNLTAIAIRRLIKMSKKVNAFKNMCQEDQVALLKGGCTEMMILRSAMTYDPDRDSWKIPHSKEKPMNIKLDVLKEAGGKVFEEHERFLQTFDPRWRNDENIMLILSAITLFTPDRPRVVHYDVIKLEQNSYYYLLRRYLESIYQGCEARSTFLKLISKIAELHRLNEDHVRVYLDVNPKDIEPLLIEIFDLKSH